MPTPNALIDELDAISKTFVTSIVAAMRRASLADILGVEGGAPARRGPGRPKGSTSKPAIPTLPAEVTTATTDGMGSRIDLLVAYVTSHPGTTGLAARKAIGLPAPHWATYVSRGVNRGRLRKEGRGQGARYWAV